MSYPYDATFHKLDKASYKLAIQNGMLYGWLAELETHYHSSTQWYVRTVQDYRSFLTVARQVLKACRVIFKSKQICMNGVLESVLLFKLPKQGSSEASVTG